MNFEEYGTKEDFGKIVSQALITNLVKRKLFIVLEREKIDKVLQEQALSLSGVVKEEEGTKLGELLGADALIFGSVSKIDKLIKIDCRFVNVEFGIIFFAESVICKDEREIDKIIAILGDKIQKEFPPEGEVVDIKKDKIYINFRQRVWCKRKYVLHYKKRRRRNKRFCRRSNCKRNDRYCGN